MAEVRRTVTDAVPSPIVADIRRPGAQVEYRLAAIRRISWGAVLAGVVIALMIQLVLHLLRIGIGMRTSAPLTGDIQREAIFGIAAGIWWMASWCLTLSLGGWAAGRLAGMPRRLDAALHGVLTWAFTLLILLYLLTTAVGNLMHGEFSAISTLMATSGPGTATGVPGLDFPWENVRHDIEATLRHTGQAPFQPDPLGETAQRSPEPSEVAHQDLISMIDRLIRQDNNAISTADREAVIAVLVARTGMSQEQAAWTLQRWEQDYQRARAELAQTSRQAVDTTAQTASQTFLRTVLALVLGAIAAAIGGALGTPRDLLATVVREA